MKEELIEKIKKDLSEYGLVKKNGKEITEEDALVISNIFCEAFVVMTAGIKNLLDVFVLTMNSVKNKLTGVELDFEEVKSEKIT